MRFLEAQLPDTYLLIPNVRIEQRNPYNNSMDARELDLVVVAPHALYHLENKDWKGHLVGDDTTWTVNGKERKNPFRTARTSSQILASRLKAENPDWGRAWVDTAITLSDPSMMSRQLSGDIDARVFGLDKSLVLYVQDPAQAKSHADKIRTLQTDIVNYLTGLTHTPRPQPRLFESDYEILEVVSQSETLTEFLVRPRGLATTARKRIRAFAVETAGLSTDDRDYRLRSIRNQYDALLQIGANPALLPVTLLTDAERGEVYEISDYLDENSLRTELNRRTWSLPEKLALFRSLAQGVRAAHLAPMQVLHRDIRPENIFVTPAGAFLGNFSRAFFWSASRGEYTVMPRPSDDPEPLNYRAPELDDALTEATEATDVYGLGLTMYEVLTGQPLLTDSWHDLDHMGGGISPGKRPGAVVPGIPPWLDTLIGDMVRLNVDERLQSMAEVLNRLEKGISQTVNTPVPTPAQPSANAPAPSAYDTLRPGYQASVYTFIERIGDGGFSEVWRVKHSLQGKDFAMKVYNESVQVGSVLDEFNALKGLSHPNIVRFEWNEQLPSGRYYTLMELLEGSCLQPYVTGEQRLPLPVVYQIGFDLTNAFRYLHERESPIYHRDVKPTNIIWHKNERFVLIDFNVAAIDQTDQDNVGTNRYRPPDRFIDINHIQWDESCDTFALGVTLHELVCKRHPWATNRPSLHGTPPTEPGTLRSDLSDAFAAFLWKAIQPRRADRFATAQVMQEALASIGVMGLLRPQPQTSQFLPAVTITHTPDFVRALNRLFSQSKWTNAGTRGLDDFARQTYIDTRLDTRLKGDVLSGQYRLVIITGNAGDGKTAFIQNLEAEAEQMGLPQFQHLPNQNGATFRINGVRYQSNWDGSQDEGDTQNTAVLDAFFAPFRGINDFRLATEGRIIAINEGRLVEYLTERRGELGYLERAVDEFFYREGTTELPAGLLLVNLNLRSVINVGQGTADESIFRRQVKKLTHPDYWQGCNDCAVRSQCFIRYNAQTLADTDAGDEVLSRMERLLLTVHLRRELHLTMRDLRSLVAFWLTRDHTCEEVADLVAMGEAMPLLEKYYVNLSDHAADDAGNNDRLVRLLRQTDVGLRALPALDRGLFFNPLRANDYVLFGQRDIAGEPTLLDWLNTEKEVLNGQASADDPAHRELQQQMHRLLARHQYFEGKINPALRLPYRALANFTDVLLAEPTEQQKRLAESQQEIGRALAVLENCPPNLGERYVVLSVGEKDPQAMSYRLFELTDFELKLGVPPRLTEYLEYVPDRLLFRHREHPHVSMELSLDLYEMLIFIGKGYRPSLEDLKGRFQELQLFKNLLANLPYRQVVVTENHRDYYTISATAQNKLVVERTVI